MLLLLSFTDLHDSFGVSWSNGDVYEIESFEASSVIIGNHGQVPTGIFYLLLTGDRTPKCSFVRRSEKFRDGDSQFRYIFSSRIFIISIVRVGRLT